MSCREPGARAGRPPAPVSSGGVTIRMEVREISSQGRDATGVRIMNLDDGQTVASVAPIIASDDE